MPRPPEIDAFTDLKFITNYVLAGCTGDSHLIMDFSQAPTKDLLMLFFIPDLEDIGQAIFQPKGGRRRKPARHGRKRRRLPGIPDPSDIIGQGVRAHVNPYDALDFGPLRKAWQVYDVTERFNFTVAVIEGITNIGYETLWGTFSVDPNQCKEFDRLSVTDSDFQTVGGVGPTLQSFNIDDVHFNSGFRRTRTACRNDSSSFGINLKVTFRNGRFDIRASGYLGFWNTTTDEYYRESFFDLDPGEQTTREVTVDVDANEWIAWGIIDSVGFVDVYFRSVLAFSDEGLPW